ncbi:MAG: hypothetical protein JRI68_26660 [Deltaproteobacteria bacterium]|nr:hypothetical protein [Deltaproteobacteria bacterium]
MTRVAIGRLERHLAGSAFFLFMAATVGCAVAPPPEPKRIVVTHHEPERKRDEIHLTIDIPPLPEQASCREARAAYIESWDLTAGDVKPDLSLGLYGSVLGRGHYLEPCHVPDTTEVSICAAVQNGEVVGATVATHPHSRRHERCIERNVRALSFPENPRMDVTKTVFRAAAWTSSAS